jgi:hypothetical protein
MPKDEKPSPASIPAPEPVEETPNLAIQPPPLTWLQKSYYKGKSSSDGSDTTDSREKK